ncbi:MAG: hypothetical protein LBQ38_03055 [Spirochaetaceae bacterium]|jgi:hypothetical protein|nr:hypothetical protein [Spirochaetaceae bacterium]
MYRVWGIGLLWLLLIPAAIYGQYGEAETGDPAVADRYAEWAGRAVDEGRWPEAEAALERATDYADVSSDLSWLLALVRLHENRPQGTVLEALRRAIGVNRWTRYAPGPARLLEAAILIRLRFHTEALEILSFLPESADAALLRLYALRGLQDMPQFRDTLARTVDRYPRDPRPLRLLFEAARGRLPDEIGGDLMDRALRRLPLLLPADPELAWLGAPFMGDTDEAGRLIAAYRASGGRSPEAIPAALFWGVIGENQAIEELFSAPAPRTRSALGGILAGVSAALSGGPAFPEGRPVLDKALILSVREFLRNKAGREEFRRNLLRFSGVITEDRDGDGFPESQAWYQDGMVQSYYYDEGQDGLPELTVFFNAGLPLRGEAAILPEPGETGRERALVFWERYPALLRVDLGGRSYFPRPLTFFFSPLRLRELAGSGLEGFVYPETDGNSLRIGRRSLVSFSVTIEGPGEEFAGALERVEMDRGVPLRASEWLEGRLVSVTEFVSGRPLLRRLDLDLDGRLETIRSFTEAGLPLSSESDWDGDRIYETGEDYFPDGRVFRLWDMDRDGIKEYSYPVPGNDDAD